MGIIAAIAAYAGATYAGVSAGYAVAAAAVMGAAVASTEAGWYGEDKGTISTPEPKDVTIDKSLGQSEEKLDALDIETSSKKKKTKKASFRSELPTTTGTGLQLGTATDKPKEITGVSL